VRRTSPLSTRAPMRVAWAPGPPCRARRSPACAGALHSPYRRARAPRGHRPPGVVPVWLIKGAGAARSRVLLVRFRRGRLTLTQYLTRTLTLDDGMPRSKSSLLPCGRAASIKLFQALMDGITATAPACFHSTFPPRNPTQEYTHKHTHTSKTRVTL